MGVPGGVTDAKPATDEIQTLIDSVKDSVSSSITGAKKTKLHPFKAVSYKTQVVAGLNYFVKVAIDDGNEYIHLRVFRPLGDNPKPQLARHEESHTVSSDLKYF